MTIDKKLEGTKLEITLEGRLDTITAPTLEGELKQSLDGITELVFDFGKLEYISSAGLRILMMAVKRFGEGSVCLTHVNAVVREILETTGFDTILRICD